VLCNLALEVSRVVGLPGYPWQHKTPWFPLVLLLGTVVVWLVVGLVHAVLGRLWLTAAVMATLTVVVIVADHEKVRLRREPLLPSDLRSAGEVDFLTDMVGPSTVALAVVALVVVVTAAVLAHRWAGSRRGHPRPGRTVSGRERSLVRLGVVLLAVLGLLQLGAFNQPGNPVRTAYDALGADWRPWSQQRNYLGNGFVGGFLYNLDVPEPPRPPGYSAAAMRRVVARYTALAARINRTRDPGALDDLNVVMVLSESFSDPLALEGLRSPEDPIPFVRALSGRTTSGTMLAQSIGGGTANMEFEALTGMSLALFPPQTRVPFQMLVPQYTTFPSAVRWFEEEGHHTVAIHPFTTEMYRRSDVYRALGFDRFVHDETMRDRTRDGHDGYIADSAAFAEVVRSVARAREPLFVNLVTMQNHIPYRDRYDDPVPVTDEEGEPVSAETGQYLRGLSHTDAAVRGLLRGLARLDEPTVVVFYGDHLPGTYPDVVLRANPRLALHRTPFFVWSSFAAPDLPQPLTSPTHFVDLALERADATLSPYHALLHELRQQVPAMDAGMMFGPTGERLVPGRLPAAARRVLRDYRLVQYDLSVGERHAARQLLGAAR
jgi:phosphoglycerol transferase MdoB-like AlkP superfamily enzyme